MFGTQTWELCQRSNQSLLAPLDGRLPGAKVDITRHQARAAQLAISLDDAAAPLVSVGDAVLRCTVAGWTNPLFVGRITQEGLLYDEQNNTLTISALDPWVQVQKAGVYGSGIFGGGVLSYLTYTATQQATIINALLAHAISRGVNHGIVAGLAPSSTTKTLSFPAGSNIADAILSITGYLDGIEFELTPKQAVDGSLATINMYYPRQGSDLSASIIVKIGIDENDTATAFSYTPAIDGIHNRHTVIGDATGIATLAGLDYPSHPAYVAEHAASQAAYGVFEDSEFLSGVTDPTILASYAKAIVAANAIPTDAFALTLDPERGPEFGPGKDVWMGDTIAAQAGLPEETMNLSGRIASASIVENENGDADVVVACEPEASSGVTGSTATVVIDSAEGTPPPPPPVPEIAPSTNALIGDPVSKLQYPKKKKKK